MLSIHALTLEAYPSISSEVDAFLLTSSLWIYPLIQFSRSGPLLISKAEAFYPSILFLFSTLNQLNQRIFTVCECCLLTGSPYSHFQTKSTLIHSVSNQFTEGYFDDFLCFLELLMFEYYNCHFIFCEFSQLHFLK